MEACGRRAGDIWAHGYSTQTPRRTTLKLNAVRDPCGVLDSSDFCPAMRKPYPIFSKGLAGNVWKPVMGNDCSPRVDLRLGTCFQKPDPCPKEPPNLKGSFRAGDRWQMGCEVVGICDFAARQKCAKGPFDNIEELVPKTCKRGRMKKAGDVWIPPLQSCEPKVEEEKTRRRHEVKDKCLCKKGIPEMGPGIKVTGDIWPQCIPKTKLDPGKIAEETYQPLPCKKNLCGSKKPGDICHLNYNDQKMVSFLGKNIVSAAKNILVRKFQP